MPKRIKVLQERLETSLFGQMFKYRVCWTGYECWDRKLEEVRLIADESFNNAHVKKFCTMNR